MKKNLGISGHPTRSKEVVELLKILGGKNSNGYKCSNPNRFYQVLNEHICWGYIGLEEFVEYEILTLEEFLEKYPFKIGDKVFDTADGDTGTIVDMKWDKDVSDMKYRVAFDNGDMGWYTNDTIGFLKKEDNLEETQSNQVVDNFRKEFCECCGSQRCSGQDDELEYCERFKNLMDNSGKPSAKNHKMGPKSKLPSKYYDEMPTKKDMEKPMFKATHILFPETPHNVNDKLEYKIIDGYKFDRVENDKIILKVVKPKYPKTYRECCKVLKKSTDITPDVSMVSPEESLLFSQLIKLKRCRDAYWKIAGEEMGLDKPWEPNWQNTEERKFCIIRINDNVVTKWQTKTFVRFLTLPTEEMCETFYENFKDLIESCKELV